MEREELVCPDAPQSKYEATVANTVSVEQSPIDVTTVLISSSYDELREQVSLASDIFNDWERWLHDARTLNVETEQRITHTVNDSSTNYWSHGVYILYYCI